MEPKILYRAAIEEVPDEIYTLPLDKADVLQAGSDLTIISYGRPLFTCQQAIEAVKKDRPDISIELIDLRSIYPWDREAVLASVRKTGRAVIVHESMVNYGVGAEIAATIQENILFHLKGPVRRLGGWSTHTGLSYEKYILPDVTSMPLPLHNQIQLYLANLASQECTITFFRVSNMSNPQNEEEDGMSQETSYQ
jgi:2-oxoisovalerate dehydrogenase E1 component beta subunit